MIVSKLADSDVNICKGTTFSNLTIFPLTAHEVRPPGYATLDEAILSGEAKVTEVSKGGSVPELALENAGTRPVLVLDGEELVGAKQNRIANLTVLAPPGRLTIIPVSCVEAGRWSYSTEEFGAAGRTLYSRGRASKARSVSESMRFSETRSSDQHEVWNDISAKSQRMNVSSPTGAISDVFDRHEGTLRGYLEGFDTTPDQVGAIFAIDDRIEGFDLFDSPQTLAKSFKKLVQSYAIDAIETAGPSFRAPSEDDAQRFLDRFEAAQIERYPAVGLGEDVRLTGPGVIGGGLVVDDRVVHLVGFAHQIGSRGGPSDGSRISRSRARRYRSFE
jgi:hypothetical protein